MLMNLEELSLSGNTLSFNFGPLPIEWATWDDDYLVDHIDLHGIDATFETERLSNLRKLNLGWTEDMNGLFPSEIVFLTNLEELRIEHNYKWHFAFRNWSNGGVPREICFVPVLTKIS